MVESPLWTLLVSHVGATALLNPGLVAATAAAIAMSAITRNAYEKYGEALCLEAHSMPENYGFLGRRHALSEAGLDNGTRFVTG
jgi:UPF0716 family protein affecting phage T7 exclusion